MVSGFSSKAWPCQVLAALSAELRAQNAQPVQRCKRGVSRPEQTPRGAQLAICLKLLPFVCPAFSTATELWNTNLH